MSRGPGANMLVERALVDSADAAGCAVTIPASETRRWASATFVGAQHEIGLAATWSPDLDAWIAALPDAEFTLRGHLVADLVVKRASRDGDAVSVQLEILTVEER